MQEVLNEIADLPGVVGSCLFSKENGKMCSGLPPAFTDDTVQTIAHHTSRLVQMGGMVDMDIQSVSMRFDTYSVITMPVDGETLLMTACGPQTNSSLVTTTFSMLAGELKNGLSKKPAAPVVQEEVVPIEPLLDRVREALAFVVGPMADMVFDDHLDVWKKKGAAVPARLPELIEMLATEVDEDSVAEFRKKAQTLLSPPQKETAKSGSRSGMFSSSPP